MADRFRKRMDAVAGRGGVKCYCCGLGRSQQTSIRMWFNKELRKEIDNVYNDEDDVDTKSVSSVVSGT